MKDKGLEKEREEEGGKRKGEELEKNMRRGLRRKGTK